MVFVWCLWVVFVIAWKYMEVKAAIYRQISDKVGLLFYKKVRLAGKRLKKL